MALDFIHSPLFKQIMRFAVTGGIAFVIDFGLLLILTELVHLDYLVSATISFIVSVWVNYVLSMMWVFTQARSKSRLLASSCSLYSQPWACSLTTALCGLL